MGTCPLLRLLMGTSPAAAWAANRKACVPFRSKESGQQEGPNEALVREHQQEGLTRPGLQNPLRGVKGPPSRQDEGRREAPNCTSLRKVGTAISGPVPTKASPDPQGPKARASHRVSKCCSFLRTLPPRVVLLRPASSPGLGHGCQACRVPHASCTLPSSVRLSEGLAPHLGAALLSHSGLS